MVICCKTGIILLLIKKVRTHHSVSIIPQLQQTIIDLRKKRPDRKISHHLIPRLIAAIAANLPHQCSKQQNLQQNRTGQSGPGTTKNSRFQSRRPRAGPAGRKDPGMLKNIRKSGGPGPRTSRRPGGSAGHVTIRG